MTDEVVNPKAIKDELIRCASTGESNPDLAERAEFVFLGEYNKILSQFSIACKTIEAVDKNGNLVTGCQFGKQKRENGVLESAYVARLDDQHERTTAIAMSEAGIGKCVADALFERYGQEAQGASTRCTPKRTQS